MSLPPSTLTIIEAHDIHGRTPEQVKALLVWLDGQGYDPKDVTHIMRDQVTGTATVTVLKRREGKAYMIMGEVQTATYTHLLTPSLAFWEVAA